MLVGQAVALEALEVLALMLSSTLGLISLALALVHSSAQDCQAVALEALVALALLISSMLGSISLALAPLLSSAQDCRALELMLVGHADALEALVALALNIRPLVSQASTTTSSINASVTRLALVQHAPSVMRRLLTTASRAAKEHVCSDGASPGASRAQPLPKPLCKRALVLLLRQQLHAWSPVPLPALPVNRQPSRTWMPMHWEQPVTSVAIRPSV